MNNLNAASLIKAGRAVREPFQLSVARTDGTSSQIIVRKILRLLPGRRIVAVADQDDCTILVKIFIGRSAGRYSRREVHGVESIAGTSVPTPALVWQGSLQEGGGQIVAFEYLEEARDLIDEWQESSDEARIAMMHGVIPELARLHEGGVVQNDIHPENFLISAGQVYMIDGGDVSRVSNAPLSESRSLRNLSLFLAQFHARYDKFIPEVLAAYEKTRMWPASDQRVKRLRENVLKDRARRKNNYIEKAFRECTRFSCQSTSRRFTVVERKLDSPDMQKLLQNPDQAIEDGILLKKGNTATVARVEGPDGPLVIKRYNIKNFNHRLMRLFRKSRAWVSWANTLRLEFLGVSTLAPVALIEERLGPLRGRAYFITQYEEGCDATLLAERSNPEADMTSMVEILRNLSEAGITHGDLKASNFILTNRGAVLIDLDSMKEHAEGPAQKKIQRRDWERFLKNWDSAPELQQRFVDLLEVCDSVSSGS